MRNLLSATLTFSFILTVTLSCESESELLEKVRLLIPEEGAILDNGCVFDVADSIIDFSDSIVWFFDWVDYPSAEKYHLYVIHLDAVYPVIDNPDIFTSEYTDIQMAYIVDRNRLDWTWQVKAFVNHEWIEWSEIRTFDVEPVNSDCN